MKRTVFLVLAGVAAMALAATPADAAKRKGKRAPAAPAVTDVNDASWRLVRDSIPMWLPTPIKIIYFANNPEARK